MAKQVKYLPCKLADQSLGPKSTCKESLVIVAANLQFQRAGAETDPQSKLTSRASYIIKLWAQRKTFLTVRSMYTCGHDYIHAPTHTLTHTQIHLWGVSWEYPSLLSIAIINNMAKSNFGKKWFIPAYSFWSIIKGRQGRNAR